MSKTTTPPRITIKHVDPKTLSPDPANARKHDKRNLDAIKASLRKFGQQKPIVVDENGTVIAGNGTLEAAKALGWTKIAIVKSDLKGAEAIAYAIADNRTAELADWDDDALRATLSALAADDSIDEFVTGFDDTEIKKLIGGDGDDADAGDPEDIPVADSFGVLVECTDEKDQQAMFERLSQEGRKCRVLTL